MEKETKRRIGIWICVVTMILAIPIIVVGSWMISSNSCVKSIKSYKTPGFSRPQTSLVGWVVIIGALMLVSGFWCCLTFWLDKDRYGITYRIVMGILLLIMFGFVIALAAYSNYSGSAKKAPGRGYAEYRFGSFSSWLREKVSDENGWTEISTCLGISDGPCADLRRASFSSSQQLYAANLTPLQSGCCIPPQSCNFTFVSPSWDSWPTSWVGINNQTSALDADCAIFNNDINKLCLDCQSCKAGVLVDIRKKLKKTIIVLTFFFILEVVAYFTICYI
ncbi:unnamed protein product [Cuscuta epithymum]|uniref:Uncharacterized protein n=1 Tax=Cuscuta epithymum TaxID=186058 RepID=A0AAV0CWW2_9ASTE|nr:unnamed protein product [Cuscuta epithymum]